MARCTKCGEQFANAYQLGPHIRACGFASDSDEHSSFSAEESHDDAQDDSQDSHDEEMGASQDALYTLAQRRTHTPGIIIPHVPQRFAPGYNPELSGNFVPAQRLWRRYVQQARDLCSKEFWSLFQVVNEETGACADAVLQWTKKTLQAQPCNTVPLGHKWPSCRRRLRKRIDSKAGLFWDNVTISVSIDMGKYADRFPSKVEFSFVDPIFVWVQHANRLIKSGHKLEFTPQVLHSTSGGEMYGSGVQYGLIMRAAHRSIPVGGRPALMNLSWDGGSTGYASRSASPICMQVMNCNTTPVHCIGLVGYVPHLETSDAWLHTDAYKDAKFHLLQECIGNVIRCIERYAQHGFKCVLGEEEALLFPRLTAMTLDTPERAKYFGLQNQRSCGFCRLRNGRSLWRLSTRQDQQLIDLLMRWATCEAHSRASISQRAKARAKLKRHGFNYKYRCRLMDVAKHCLVVSPQFPHTPFGGLLHYERMHTFFINYCTYLMEILSQLVPKQHYNQVNNSVRQCHQFRDPYSGRTHPRLKSVLKMTHLTAERRVRAIFYWAHVLGTRAEVIPAPMRAHSQVAVSMLQLLLIAVRGHRAYTKEELELIFNDVGSEFFKALEKMSQFLDQDRMQKGQTAHENNPENTNPPVPFKRQRRYANAFQITFLLMHLLLIRHICFSVNAFALNLTDLFLLLMHLL